MELHVNFIEDIPGSNVIAQVVYYSLTGGTVPCVIDVFIDDMKEVAYTLPEKGIFTATSKDQSTAVAVLTPSTGKKTDVGVSIRKPTDKLSSSSQDIKIYWDYVFGSKPEEIE